MKITVELDSFKIKQTLWVSNFEICQSKSEIMVDWCLGLRHFLPGFRGCEIGHAQPRWRELVFIPLSSRPLREGPLRPSKAPPCAAMPCVDHKIWCQNSCCVTLFAHRIGRGDEMEYLDSDDLTRKNWSAGRGKNGSCCNSLPLLITHPEKLRYPSFW